MSFPGGTRIGAYHIVSLLGEGGMGAVYRARDTKLNRDVALKVLLPEVANDPERLARFRREAQVLAALNHPNIAAIYGLEDGPAEAGPHMAGPHMAGLHLVAGPHAAGPHAAGPHIAAGAHMVALVMELVDGEDLSQRIARGPVPLDEALPIARQIAEALEAAHEQGIVHRDLKPANIKVRPDGTVKVLDFGLAKAMERAGPAEAGPYVRTGEDARGGRLPDLSNSPTITSPAMMTGVGVILGTAAYMAPEQASGKPVDKRADIWAFGVVLLEMLTGQRPFAGESVSHVLAAVLKDQPDFSALPGETPLSVRRLLRRCLEKDRRQRLADASDARLEIEDALTRPDVEAGSARPGGAVPAARQTRLVWTMAAAAALGMAALAIPAVRHAREAAAVEMRTEITTPPTDAPESFALAPDGSQIAFVAAGERNRDQLWVRALGTTALHPLAGTEGAAYPFWSPDGRSLGFFAADQLKRVDVATSVVRTLAPAVGGRGGTWSADGVILFTPTLSPVLRVSADGGQVSPVTTLAGGTGHRFPQFLPDGRRFLFWVAGAGDAAGVFLTSLDGGAPARLTASDSAATYTSSGWLLWNAGGTLLSQRLDLDRRVLHGARVTVAEGTVARSQGPSGVSTAATGLVAYRPVGEGRLRQLQWFDRAGTALGAIGPQDATLANMRLSPDGRRVAVVRTAPGTANEDVWIFDGTREIRVTSSEDRDDFPVWSPDGGSLAFSTRIAGSYVLQRKAANGAGREQAVGRVDGSPLAEDWSYDGRFLLFGTFTPRTSADVWVWPLSGEGSPAPLLQEPFSEEAAFFSPDDRWIAYESNESGQREVVIRAFVPPGLAGAGTAASPQWQVSSGGGRAPRWRADGRELFYVGPDGSVMAVAITVKGAAVEAGTPVALFSSARIKGLTGYDVAPDGRFLINALVGEAVAPPIVLVQHWTPEAAK